VLAGITDTDAPPVLATPAPPAPVVHAAAVPETLHAQGNDGTAPLGNPANGDAGSVDHPQDGPQHQDLVRDIAEPVEDGPVHRPLIRATLPRLEGHKEVRQATDFTIRQSNGRGANFQNNQRGGDQRARPHGGQGQGQGQPSNRPPGGGARFAGARPGNQSRGASSGRPPGGGFRAGQTQRRGGSGAPGAGGAGRKRSR
jgi:hypothetical protein